MAHFSLQYIYVRKRTSFVEECFCKRGGLLPNPDRTKQEKGIWNKKGSNYTDPYTINAFIIQYSKHRWIFRNVFLVGQSYLLLFHCNFWGKLTDCSFLFPLSSSYFVAVVTNPPVVKRKKERGKDGFFVPGQLTRDKVGKNIKEKKNQNFQVNYYYN